MFLTFSLNLGDCNNRSKINQCGHTGLHSASSEYYFPIKNFARQCAHKDKINYVIFCHAGYMKLHKFLIWCSCVVCITIVWVVWFKVKEFCSLNMHTLILVRFWFDWERISKYTEVLIGTRRRRITGLTISPNKFGVFPCMNCINILSSCDTTAYNCFASPMSKELCFILTQKDSILLKIEHTSMDIILMASLNAFYLKY